jgi:phosphoglycolate phosphatase
LKNNYKHIIWDWNGTLLDDTDFCRKIINRILIQNKLPALSLSKYRQIFTFPVQDYYQSAGLDFSKTSFEILGKDFIDEYESKKLTCSLHDNVVEILSAVKEEGIGQSVLSAYLHENLISILDHYKLTQYFDNISGLDNIYAGSKTHLGLKLIKDLDVNKNEVLLIGDTLHDAEVAKAIGVNCILIADGHQAKEKLYSNGNLVLRDLVGLKSYLFL